GGVQWMTAGRGILHSEMPEQEEGLLKGFQLWVNLPAAEKLCEPGYQEFSPQSIPLEHRADGTRIRVIAGQTNQGTLGAVHNDFVDPIFLDVSLPANALFQQGLPATHNAFVYVVEGSMGLLDNQQAESDQQLVKQNELGVLSQGGKLSVKSGLKGARFLLIAGKPLNEPVARGGPFVMNTKEEVLQAFSDFRRGNF
ncbi:MAG: pirin family protein, partial [Pseudomonadales bacterium]|nr:pirin family protein [Pseudomonadales bacterium]